MRAINIALEVYDKTTTIEEIEKCLDKALNDSGIDCSYHVEEEKRQLFAQFGLVKDLEGNMIPRKSNNVTIER